MFQETFVKWALYFITIFIAFKAQFSVKMFHLFKMGFLGQEGLMYNGIFVCKVFHQ